MTMSDSPHPALAGRSGPPAPSAAAFVPSRAQLPLGLRARDGRLLSESLLAHVPSTTGAVEPERVVGDHAQLSLFASSFATRRPR